MEPTVTTGRTATIKGQMFQPNYPKSAIGIEHDFVAAVSLRKEGRGTVGVRQAATVGLAPEVLNPNFTDRNILKPDDFAAALEDVCVRAGLQGQKKWSVSLPGNTARTAVLTLENAPKSGKELEEVLDWKCETGFGAPIAEMRIARRQLAALGDGKTRFLATAVKLAVIDEFETIFESFGWQAGLIMPRSVCESNWLGGREISGDSLLISSNSEGFTAILMRHAEPVVIRNVTCRPEEVDDEIYRLLMFYNDRFGADGNGALAQVLFVGDDGLPQRFPEISSEALGRDIAVLEPEEVGFMPPPNGLTFAELAAPAGLAALGL